MDASLFERRNYPVTSATEGYGEWAATYEDTVAEGLDEPLLERLTAIAWADTAAAIDLACGTGRIGAWMKSRGVGAIDGVDLTPEMLKVAEKKAVYRSLTVGNVAATRLAAGAYQLATMSLADEHLPALGPVYREAARLLAPGGQFVLIGYHPFFLMNGLVTHFHRAGGEAVTIRSYVHLFADHFRAATDADLALEAVEECVIDEEWLARKPKWRPYLNWPVSFALVWRKD